MTKLKTRSLTVSEAIAEAIAQEMERDVKILVLGEDIGTYGGVFSATEGLLERFGPKRVRDTPISEMAFTGMGIGLVMAGYRPLIEIMFADFIGVCLEQVYNAMAKIPYMSGGRVRMPMVVKTAGGCIGAAAQHSQCLWGLFAHLPGMRVVVPSSPYNAKGLMTAALRSDDPVVFIEHKSLMRRKPDSFHDTRPVDEDAYELPIDRAEVVREGNDLTVVTLSRSVDDALTTADILGREGLSIEVIDLLAVVPLDMETVTRSVAKTRRLLVVDEDYLSFGLSAEVVARTVEGLGGKLERVSRLAVPDVPIPASRPLEEAVLPSTNRIVAAARKVLFAD